MRPFALSALLLVAAVGCGVPDTPVPAETPAKPVAKETEIKPKTPDVTAKPAEQDPAKLGEKVVDTKVGSGKTAEPGDTCVMRYTGKLTDGSVFDSNMNNGKDPFSFTLGSGQVIKGWDLGVKGMKVGGKRTLTIPPELGYGAQSQDKIPANSTLVFDIELLDVQKAGDATTVERSTLTEGKGVAAKDGDVVTIKYRALSADGKVLDDNGGKAVQMKVGDPAVTIQGLNLALVGMKAGQKVMAKIPAELGYMGPPRGRITPHSPLNMEIELVKIG